MNPAALLHARLAQYRTPEGQASLSTRFHITDDNNTSPVISDGDRAALLEAADWLRRIDRLIDAFEREGRQTGAARRAYPYWVNAVFTIGISWGSLVTPEEVCPESRMDVLETFAALVDFLTPGLDGPAHAQLVDLVTRVSKALDGDDTLSDQLRIHLRRVVDHLRACVEHPEAYDLNDVAEAADDVITAAKAAAGESTHSTWKKFWETLHTCYVAPAVAGLIAGYGPNAIHAAIETGQRLLSS